MRIRRLTDPNKLIRGGEPLLLAPNKTVELAPDVLVQVELDLAVRVDPGSALLIVPLPSLLEAGVIAAVGVVTASDPLSPLTISVRAIAPATLRPNKPIARGVVLDAPPERFYEDAALDTELAGSELTFETGDVEPAETGLRFNSDDSE